MKKTIIAVLVTVLTLFMACSANISSDQSLREEIVQMVLEENHLMHIDSSRVSAEFEHIEFLRNSDWHHIATGGEILVEHLSDSTVKMIFLKEKRSRFIPNISTAYYHIFTNDPQTIEFQDSIAGNFIPDEFAVRFEKLKPGWYLSVAKF